jgi:hypothetical protein
VPTIPAGGCRLAGILASAGEGLLLVRLTDGPPADDPRRCAMGFNATRRYRDDKRNDLVLLAVAIVVVLGMLAWGFGLF